MTEAMTLQEFREIDALLRAQNPRIFLLSSPDRHADDLQIHKIERLIGRKLPVCYAEFMKEFGGGSYGLTTVFSADSKSDWYLPRKMVEAAEYLPEELLPFSDDFSGGVYVFREEGGVINEEVYYWNSDGGITPAGFKNIFEFVASTAFPKQSGRSERSGVRIE